MKKSFFQSENISIYHGDILKTTAIEENSIISDGCVSAIQC